MASNTKAEAGNETTPLLHNDQPIQSRAALLVTNISPTISVTLLRLFFESGERSGGGEIEQISFGEENTRCVIVFKDVNSR